MKRTLIPCLLTVLALGLGAGCKQPADPADIAAPDIQITGAWRSHVQFGSGPFVAIKDLEFMYVFNAGGTLTESSNYDAAPPVPPAYGIWKRTGRNTFEAQYEFYLTRIPERADGLGPGSGWLPAGRGVFRESITIADDARSFTSRIIYTAYDALGRPTPDTGEAAGEGTPITF